MVNFDTGDEAEFIDGGRDDVVGFGGGVNFVDGSTVIEGIVNFGDATTGVAVVNFNGVTVGGVKFAGATTGGVGVINFAGTLGGTNYNGDTTGVVNFAGCMIGFVVFTSTVGPTLATGEDTGRSVSFRAGVDTPTGGVITC